MNDLKAANHKFQDNEDKKELPTSFHIESDLLTQNRFNIKNKLQLKLQQQFKFKLKQSELDIMKSNLEVDTITKIID